MAPNYREEEIAQNLNNIFAEDNKNVTISNIKSPTGDFTREIIIAALKESGFNLGTFNLPAEMTSAMSSGIDLAEYLTPLQLMVTARHFFDHLIEAAGEKITDENTFGLNDLLTPETRRLKYFLSHFINYWLLCNSQYLQYQGVTEEVEQKAKQKIEYEEAIENLKAKNVELRKNKASSAMKAEKLRSKIDHDKNKLGKLTEDVASLQEKIGSVKTDLSDAKQTETEHYNQIKTLEKTEFRLKTISKADETKQELETQLETLKSEEEGKLYQVKNYQHKAEKMDEEESHLKEAIENLKITKDLHSKKKKSANEKKSTMLDCNTAHEELSKMETQIAARKRSYEALKSEIAKIKSKWDKNKGMMENDLIGYTEKLSSMTKAMTEDDMASHELDSNISETMMKTDEIKESIRKEKEATEKSAAKLFAVYDQFMKVLSEDYEKLREASEEMKNVKPKYK